MAVGRLCLPMLKFLRSYLDDLLLVAGCSCILYGLSLLNAVIAWIAAGVMLIAFGVLVGRTRNVAD